MRTDTLDVNFCVRRRCVSANLLELKQLKNNMARQNRHKHKTNRKILMNVVIRYMACVCVLCACVQCEANKIVFFFFVSGAGLDGWMVSLSRCVRVYSWQQSFSVNCSRGANSEKTLSGKLLPHAYEQAQTKRKSPQIHTHIHPQKLKM